jgi:hypothetical protein
LSISACFAPEAHNPVWRPAEEEEGDIYGEKEKRRNAGRKRGEITFQERYNDDAGRNLNSI